MSQPMPPLKSLLYIAGPMTGLPEHNFPLFRSVAALYQAKGYHIISPAEGVTDTTQPWESYMRRAIGLLSQCDGIVLLPGWHQSKGALLEYKIAVALDMHIIYPPHGD